MKLKLLGYEYNASGVIVGFKGYRAGGWKYCEEHGGYPSLYTDENGKLVKIYDQRCPHCQAKEIFERLFKGSMIPRRFEGKTLESYVAKEPWQIEAKEKVSAYCRDIAEIAESGKCLVLLGGVGTGKTHLAICMLKAMINEGGAGVFLSVSDLILSIRSTWNTGGTAEKMNLYCDAHLLVLDEVGVQAGTENERQILFSIINRRYNEMKPTVLISNLDLTAFKSFVGLRIFDRLKEGGGEVLVLAGKSYRDGGKQSCFWN